jgi:2-oxoglutarate dehydrogenase E2 component (dihydrolipoamide succinyltransferase)
MTTELRIPDVGESIQEVQISHWLKQEGEHVAEDENVVELETEKASMELPSPVAGVLKIVKRAGEAAAIGETIALVEEGPEPDGSRPKADQQASESGRARQKPPSTSRPEPAGEEESAAATAEKAGGTPPAADRERDVARRSAARPTPSARRALREHGLSADEVEAAGKQLRREDVLRHVEQQKKAGGDGRTAESAKTPAPPPGEDQPAELRGKHDESEGDQERQTDQEEIVPMTMIRRRIAQRLVEAQKQAALLTTYNEIDMAAVLALRKEYGERFQKRYGVKLGLMSFFVKSVVDALQEVPELNAEIQGTNIHYRYRYDIGIAIGSEHGLVVPVLRNAERLSFADIERSIADFAARASSRKLLPRELTGGTFTISNGGIYGSLLSTPIVNPPQSGVLGMHAIQDRPVARDGQVVIRPMMYVALTYDHRIIDGREAVSWLRRVKETIEQPARMLIEA